MENHFCEYRFMIDSRDVDGHGRCRPSALLGHLQEAATLAGEEGGFGRREVSRVCGGFWMLARMRFELSRPLKWEDRVLLRTWHRGGKAAMLYRDFDLYVGEEKVGEAVSAWVLADEKSRKLLHLSSIPDLDATTGGELCKDITLRKLKMPKEMTLSEKRRMRYSDTDINTHVNNTRYADFACDALEMEKMPEEYFLSSMQLGYLAECHPEEEINIYTAGLGEEQFVRGVDDAGKIRFDVSLKFGNVRP